MRMFRLIIFLLFITTVSVRGQTETVQADTIEFSSEESILLSEIFHLGHKLGNNVWPGWSDAPFALLLVTSDHEFLVRHPNPSDDFSFLKYEETIGDSIYVRKRQFQLDLRATFPAVGGVPTIVMGLPDSTESPTQWVLTALHEHFHQLQMSKPDYYGAVNNLDLSSGDQTGQWMLNYPFPYDSSAVHDKFRELSNALKTTLETGNTFGFTQMMETYLEIRQQFRNMLAPDDYLYFSFQVWQEGVARYVEYNIGRWAAHSYTPTEDFRKLKGYEPFKEAAERIRKRIFNHLTDASLKDDRRLVFYPLGAAEALLLDKVDCDWKMKYWENKFRLDKLFICDER